MVAAGSADETGMIGATPEECASNPEHRRVLAVYADRQTAQKQADPDWAGWTTRVLSIDGIEDETLSRIHGELIAAGLLKFRLADRTKGLQYRMTGFGRQVLQGGHSASARSSEWQVECAGREMEAGPETGSDAVMTGRNDPTG